MKYVLIDMLKNGDMFNQEFNEKAAAVSAAQNAWNSLTEHDKKRRESFYVIESINPDELLKQWAVSNATLNNDAYIELIDYLNMLNSDPHCISEMQELYDFIYDFGE